jgi:hypothetical protein
VIDLTEGLEDLPEARLRAPMLEPEGYAVNRDAVHTVAHPAAIAMAVLLRRVAARRAVIQVLAPVSEQGHRRVGELRQQVINLFSFPLPSGLRRADRLNLLALRRRAPSAGRRGRG